MKNRIHIKQNDSGIALIVSLVVMFMIAVLGISYLTYASTNLMRADRDTKSIAAFYLAEAGIEYKLGQIATDIEESGADLTSSTESQNSAQWDPIISSLRSGATGAISVIADTGSTGVIISHATYKGITQTIRVVVRLKGFGVWDNAIFAGVGQAGRGINGNVDIRGSVHILGDGDSFTDLNGNGARDLAEPYTDANGNGKYDSGEPYVDKDGNGSWSPTEPYQDDNLNGQYDPPLTATDMATDLSGSANIGNNYTGIPSTWLTGNKIPALVSQDVNGETVQTLEAELRVKNGKVNLSGAAAVGNVNVAGNTTKETLDGVYVTDGYGGNKGTTNIHSDNGVLQGYDLGNKVVFPSLLAPYNDKKTGTSYSSYENYLIAKSLVVTETVINPTTTSFTHTDGVNTISWSRSTGVLTITGIIRFPGNLDISTNGSTVKFAGKGTLFAQGNVYVHGNVMPNTTFPTVDSLGVISKGNIELGTGNGESQIQAMGAWFAQKTIATAKQSTFAGTYVSNYFNMGTNVPSIFQTPKLSSNLPPGMPGSDGRVVVSKAPSWRHL